MRPTCAKFPEVSKKALTDEGLQKALNMLETGWPPKRKAAAEALPEFEELRDRARDIRAHVLDHLDDYLLQFEEQVIASGGQVHWCRNTKEARETVLKICHEADAKTVTKGKSMIGEEMALNPFLEKNGIEPIETDLGEYIIQLADEPPSHLIGPAIHKTKDQVSDLFVEHHQQYGKTERLTEGRDLVNEAREILRPKYQAADVGITGANFLIAETGSTVIVTNEGNGDLTQTLPKTHIVLASLEKVVPTVQDSLTLLRVLARSATGQEQSVYTTYSTGPKRAADKDGPENFHVILLDNGRSDLLNSDSRDILRCIRCAACLNHCPVYSAVGGHAYGWVYSGPMGSILTPALIGIEEARYLPGACTSCGRCEEVCPVRIPLPELLRYWRTKGAESNQQKWPERWAFRIWALLAKNPLLYRWATALDSWGFRLVAGKKGKISKFPLGKNWTDYRDMPAPETGGTFMQQWQKRQEK